jgi:hypothetical protein
LSVRAFSPTVRSVCSEYPPSLVAGQYIEFDLNEVVKGNPKERFEALKAADFLTLNEKCALENRDRVDEPRAVILWMLLNMTPIARARGDGGAANSATGR